MFVIGKTIVGVFDKKKRLGLSSTKCHQRVQLEGDVIRPKTRFLDVSQDDYSWNDGKLLGLFSPVFVIFQFLWSFSFSAVFGLVYHSFVAE
jgi:hypothetical protein